MLKGNGNKDQSAKTSNTAEYHFVMPKITRI